MDRSTAMPAQRTPSDLGIAFFLLRSLRGWSQEELSEATGIPAGSISEYECARTRPSRGNQERLLVALGFPEARFDGLIATVGTVRKELRKPDDDPPEIALPALDLAGTVKESLVGLEQLLLARLSFAVAGSAGASSIQEPRWDALPAALWGRLRRYPQDDRRFLIAEARTFQSPALGEWLRQEGLRRAGENPKEAAELTELGALVERRSSVDRSAPGERGAS